MVISADQSVWPKPKYSFSTVSGWFIYEDEVHPPQLPALAPNFGLRPNKKWKHLLSELQRLNASATQGEQYKLIFAGRHGEGNHNVAEEKYGTQAWDDKWALLNGDGELVWGPDPDLTPLGVSQAQLINDQWKKLLSSSNKNDDPPPLPTKLFVSPMTRAMVTLQTTFDGILLGTDSPLQPHVRELWREVIGTHTCDTRDHVSGKRKRFPGWDIDSLAEDDPYFLKIEENESNSHVRIASALSDTFDETKGHDVIAVTSHSGTMQALFKATGHAYFKPRICGVVPMIVKASPVVD